MNLSMASSSGPRMSSAVFSISGMTCSACTSAVTSGIESLEGVRDASVSLMTERASVQYDSSKISPDQIKEGIEDCGFDASFVSSTDPDDPSSTSPDSHADSPSKQHDKTYRLKIVGMTCSACSNSVENALREVPGVKNAIVALTTEEAKIVSTADVGIRSLIEAVQDAGFDAIIAESADNSSQIAALTRVRDIQQFRTDSFRCFLLSIPIILTMDMINHKLLFLHFLRFHIAGSLYLDDIINFAFVTPIQLFYGKRFYKRAYSAVKHRAPNMDVLVAISTSCAYLFSVFSCLYTFIVVNDGNHPPTLWETSAMVILFVTFGKYMENKAKGQTSAALSRLVSLVPSSTTIYEEPELFYKKFGLESTMDGEDEKILQFNKETELKTKVIPTELVQVHDVVILRPGEKVPADGVVLRGQSFISEALITGESYPVLKSPGEVVVGGSVNGSGQIDFKVLRAGDDTKLAQIVRMVRDAQTSKAPVQQLADYLAGYFVPIVLTLALATFVFWMTISAVFKKLPHEFDSKESSFMVCLRLCISVVVVACPCALGLATPTAVMVGSGVAAQNGILIKGGLVLEVAQTIDTVVFDKTGILTIGRHEAHNFKFVDKWNELFIWRMIWAVELLSEHPVAKGLVEKASLVCNEDNGAAYTENFNADIGKGAHADVIITVDGETRSHRVVIGTKKLLEEHGGNIDDFEESDLEVGATVVFVTIDGEYAGWVSLNDQLRPGAPLAVQAIKQLGYRVALLSGDSRAVALKVAKSVGIPQDMVWAEASPGGKLQVIRMLHGNDSSDYDTDFSQFEIDDEEQNLGGRLSSKNQEHKIAMVGDGINDSPALAAADLGISLSGATHAAIEAADIVLIKEKEPLIDIANAFDLSKATFRRIKINLFSAVIYNFLMIPIAMGVLLPFGIWLHPMWASAAMAVSSLSVLASSLFLQLWKPRDWRQTEVTKGKGWWVKFIYLFKKRGSSAHSYEPVSQI